MMLKVSPRQSGSAAILLSISPDPDRFAVDPGFFMLSSSANGIRESGGVLSAPRRFASVQARERALPHSEKHRSRDQRVSDGAIQREREVALWPGKRRESLLEPCITGDWWVEAGVVREGCGVDQDTI
jgi:hypothetical protein